MRTSSTQGVRNAAQGDREGGKAFAAVAAWGTAGLAFLLALIPQAGCLRQHPREVVVYSALDSEYAEPILMEFGRETGVKVLPRFDVESTKTVGLTQAIIAEARRPRCDVFWNNEILNTLRLKERGLLDAYPSPAAENYPREFRDPDGTWHGFAGRARILLVNSDVVPLGDFPSSIYDLADAKWSGRVGIAKPLFGTTATHAACLFTVLGDEPARAYFRRLKANRVRVEGGNKQVALSVASGSLAFGLTDTDDALAMIDQNRPVAIVYPDCKPGELGTLFIPNTLAIIRGCPHPEEARRLVDYLLNGEVERRLARGPSGQIPLNPNVQVELRVKSPRTVRAMPVDFAVAAQKWDAAAAFLREEFGAY